MLDLPAAPINRHWTKNVIASRDGSRLYVTVGSNSNVGENGMENEVNRAAIWMVDPATGRPFADLCLGLAQPEWTCFATAEWRAGLPSTNAMRSALTWCPTI